MEISKLPEVPLHRSAPSGLWLFNLHYLTPRDRLSRIHPKSNGDATLGGPQVLVGLMLMLAATAPIYFQKNYPVHMIFDRHDGGKEGIT